MAFDWSIENMLGYIYNAWIMPPIYDENNNMTRTIGIIPLAVIAYLVLKK